MARRPADNDVRFWPIAAVRCDAKIGLLLGVDREVASSRSPIDELMALVFLRQHDGDDALGDDWVRRIGGMRC